MTAVISVWTIWNSKIDDRLERGGHRRFITLPNHSPPPFLAASLFFPVEGNAA
jgi:hypothetical protein